MLTNLRPLGSVAGLIIWFGLVWFFFKIPGKVLYPFSDYYCLFQMVLIQTLAFLWCPFLPAKLRGCGPFWMRGAGPTSAQPLPPRPFRPASQGEHAPPTPRFALYSQTVLFIQSFLSCTGHLLAPSIKWSNSLWMLQRSSPSLLFSPDPEVETAEEAPRCGWTDALLSRKWALNPLAPLKLGSSSSSK